jgi:hypothetical protein
MKRLTATTLVCALALVGCTVEADFAVVNATPWPAALSVRLLKTERCSAAAHSSVATAPASELQPGLFRRQQRAWVPLDRQEFEISDLDCVLRVEVPPETAIRVARFFNHPPPAKAAAHLLAVQEVSVTWQPQGATQFDTASLMKAFRKARPGVYAIYPQPAA